MPKPVEQAKEVVVEEITQDVQPDPEVNEEILKALADESVAHPKVIVETVRPKKKISVLDLPMPPNTLPILDRSQANRSEEFKKYKHDKEAHFKATCAHLKVNPVVVSPCETFPDPPPLQAKTRKRPTIINRPKQRDESNERSFESYIIMKQIGEGTYGKVFKALDLMSNQLVAMKYVRVDKETEGFPLTGLREIKILRELQHPNIIQFHGIVHRDGKKNETKTFLVFEYMNHDLHGLIDNENMKLDEVTIYRILKQLLMGLDFCHKRQILHRDLKCSNILVNNKGEAKLADFGLGRQWHSDRPFTNAVISLWYRPIELLLGEEQYGPSIDIWR